MKEVITTERAIMRDYMERGIELPTRIATVGAAERPNLVPEGEVGKFRSPEARKLVTADADIIAELTAKATPLPAFLEAGPRAFLHHDPRRVRAAIVTTGGLAPGLNSVVHSIVKRHFHTYELNEALQGVVYGVYDSFIGLQHRPMQLVPLRPEHTEDWIEKGGSELGNRRTSKNADIGAFAEDLLQNLSNNNIDVLYIIGGNGSQTLAHEIATRSRQLTVVGLPKTMDNDLLWVWQSFGFNTAVENATNIINTLNSEARSTRRVCLIELFGAESGFVAANAALASGHADLVLVPELFRGLSTSDCERLLGLYIAHLKRVVNQDRRCAHGVVIVAEGVGRELIKKGVRLGSTLLSRDFLEQFRDYLTSYLADISGKPVEVFINRPLHYIRAGKANAHDQIYCERLGALAVDNALYGYTDFLISQWLTEYVLVPLELVAWKRKSIPPDGIFWKQVCASSGQPAGLDLAAARQSV
jgi:6-phosphofructokinase 1